MEPGEEERELIAREVRRDWQKTTNAKPTEDEIWNSYFSSPIGSPRAIKLLTLIRKERA